METTPSFTVPDRKELRYVQQCIGKGIRRRESGRIQQAVFWERKVQRWIDAADNSPSRIWREGFVTCIESHFSLQEAIDCASEPD